MRSVLVSMFSTSSPSESSDTFDWLVGLWQGTGAASSNTGTSMVVIPIGFEHSPSTEEVEVSSDVSSDKVGPDTSACCCRAT